MKHLRKPHIEAGSEVDVEVISSSKRVCDHSNSKATGYADGRQERPEEQRMTQRVPTATRLNKHEAVESI